MQPPYPTKVTQRDINTIIWIRKPGKLKKHIVMCCLKGYTRRCWWHYEAYNADTDTYSEQLHIDQVPWPYRIGVEYVDY